MESTRQRGRLLDEIHHFSYRILEADHKRARHEVIAHVDAFQPLKAEEQEYVAQGEAVTCGDLLIGA